MHGTSGNEDGDAGPFYAPACLEHRGHFGGGKPSPPTVPPMRYAGPLEYVEQEALCHCTVRQGGVAEDKAVRGGGIGGEPGEGLSGLWRTFGKCDGIQVSGKGDDGG